MKETTISGCPSSGNMVLLSFPAAQPRSRHVPRCRQCRDQTARKNPPRRLSASAFTAASAPPRAHGNGGVAIEGMAEAIPEFHLDPAGQVTVCQRLCAEFSAPGLRHGLSVA